MDQYTCEEIQIGVNRLGAIASVYSDPARQALDKGRERFSGLVAYVANAWLQDGIVVAPSTDGWMEAPGIAGQQTNKRKKTTTNKVSTGLLAALWSSSLQGAQRESHKRGKWWY